MPENGRGFEAPDGFESFARASQGRLYRTAYLLSGDEEAAGT